MNVTMEGKWHIFPINTVFPATYLSTKLPCKLVSETDTSMLVHHVDDTRGMIRTERRRPFLSMSSTGERHM